MTTSRCCFLLAACLLSVGGPKGAAAQDGPADPPPAGPAAGVTASGPHHVYLVGNLLVTEPRITIDPATPEEGWASFTIQNRSGSPDRLVSASTERADRIVVEADGSAGGGLPIPPRATVVIDRTNVRFLVQGLHGDVRPAGSIPGVLVFGQAGPLHVDYATEQTPAP